MKKVILLKVLKLLQTGAYEAGNKHRFDKFPSPCNFTFLLQSRRTVRF